MQASTGPKEVVIDLDDNLTVSSNTDMTTPIDSRDVILPDPDLPPVMIPNKTSAK